MTDAKQYPPAGCNWDGTNSRNSRQTGMEE